MIEQLAEFHFLRPWWLLSLLPAGVLLALLWRRSRSGEGWQGVISPELLPHLLAAAATGRQRSLLPAIAAGWLLAALALAGPSWEQLPQPVEQKEDALVIVYDLSLSMLAEDVKPSRLERSRRKLIDLLRERREGLTALVAYAGDAHVVSPLTDDYRTIANLVPALSPGMMPLPGSNSPAAVEEALKLFQAAGISSGRLLLLTDGVAESDRRAIERLIGGSPFRLSVLGVGSSEGGPIPLERQGFLKDDSGDIVIARLDDDSLARLALNHGGRYARLTLNDSDLSMTLQETPFSDATTTAEGRTVDTWHDRGYLLVLLLLPLLLSSFRRGWLLALPFLYLADSPTARAFDWQDLWSTPDQQGMMLLDRGDAEAAAERFENPDWAAAAHYRAGNYPAATQAYSTGEDARSWYNRGNALARSGDLDAAIAAYDQALSREPEHADALFNRQLLEQLREQQQQQRQQEQTSTGNSEPEEASQDGGTPQAPREQAEQNQQQQEQQAQPGQGDSGAQDPEHASAKQPDPSEAGAGEPGNESDMADGDPQQAQPEAQAPGGPAEENGEPRQATAQPGSDPTEQEDQQAMEAWLRRIPDDPAGLLRRKFQYESQQRAREGGRRDEPGW